MSGFMDAGAFKAELEKVVTEQPVQAAEQPQSNQVEADEVDLDTEEEALDAAPEGEEEGQEVEQEEEQSLEQDEDEGDNSPRIPRTRLNKEIEKRRKLEEESRAQREEFIRTKTKLEAMEAALNQMFGGEKKAEQEQALPAPTDNIDPLDPTAHDFYTRQIKALEQKVESLAQGSNQIANYQAQNAFTNAINEHVAVFKQQQPDIEEAYKYIADIKKEEASLFYSDPQQAELEAVRQLQTIASNAWRKGQNMAEVVYNLAKRTGYQPKSAAKPASGPNLAAIEQNMKKSSSIGNIPAATTTPGGGFDLEKMRTRSGGMIDPAKFQKALEREMRLRGA